MRILFRLFFVLPIALVLILFAVANRAVVNVSFDPFPGSDIGGPILAAPLFLVMIICAAVGVLTGGAAVWFGQGRYRREARDAKAEARRALDAAAALRAQLSARTHEANAYKAQGSARSSTFLPTIRHDAA